MSYRLQFSDKIKLCTDKNWTEKIRCAKNFYDSLYANSKRWFERLHPKLSVGPIIIVHKIRQKKLWCAVTWPLNCVKCLDFQFMKLQKNIFTQIAFSLSIGIADIIFFAKDNSAFYSNAWHWLYICLKLSLITDLMQYSKEYKLHLRTFFNERVIRLS